MIYFKIWNVNAKSYIKDDKNKVVEFDLITWAYYASVNRLKNMNGLEIMDFWFDEK